jgi:hypothetical protein
MTGDEVLGSIRKAFRHYARMVGASVVSAAESLR